MTENIAIAQTMIRFRRIFELTTEIDQERFAEAAQLFRSAFPHEPEGSDRIAELLRSRRADRSV